jgi:hypothetical protein
VHASPQAAEARAAAAQAASKKKNAAAELESARQAVRRDSLAQVWVWIWISRDAS